MSGLQRVLKMYGSMTVQGSEGKKVVWVWDYANDKPRIKSEMTAEEIAASERVKWNKQTKTERDGKRKNKINRINLERN